MDIDFFLLNFGVAVILLIITFTDIFYKTVDDRIIILGIGYVFTCQFYLGQIIFSITGAVVGFIISFCIFLFGNNYFTVSANPLTENEVCSKNFSTGVILPFVPSLTSSVITHALLPDGLASFLFNIILFINSHFFLILTIVITTVILLFWVMRHRIIYVDSTYFNEKDKDMAAFGDGDITTSVFLGSALGWQNFIAVFWMATVIHSIVGIIISLKQKGKFK